MASRTTYTSTVTVPVYAAWKCEHCGEVNFSAVVIGCKKEESTSSWRNSKHEEAKAKAHELAQAEWAGNAYKIITDPHRNAMAMRSDFFLQHTNCTKCGKKPKWDKDMKYLSWFGLSFMPAIISGIVAISMKTSIVAWLVFLAFLSVIIYGIVTEKKYKKTMLELPKEYTPVIGSLNKDLIEYADCFGTAIPSPDECIEIVRNYGRSPLVQKVPAQTVEETAEPTVTNAGFCRKCGTQLQADSDFCHICGTKIIKQ